MSQSAKESTKQSDWLKLMLEGQLTRDRSLRTRAEIEADKRRAAELQSLRQSLSQSSDSPENE